MWLKETGPHTECHRCGTCCVKGGPALHREDAVLLIEGKIAVSHLYTLREGEFARNTEDRLVPVEGEIVKIKGRGDGTWTCRFYDDEAGACRIYTDRPAECRALKCWDATEIRLVMGRPYLRREDLVGDEKDIRAVMDVHEKRCTYKDLRAAVQALGGPQGDRAATRILDALRYDHVVRSLVPERLDLAPDTLDFYFGRPLSVTIRMFGLEVRQNHNGFTLQPLNGGSPGE
jgi:Fe-S-cluster containining protein